MNDNTGRRKVRKVHYRLSVVFFGAVLIFGLMFYKYMKTVSLEDVLSQDRTITVFNSKDDVTGQPSNSGDSADQDDSNQPSEPVEIINPVPECESVGEDYLSDCVFIGDSITYGLSSYGVVPSSNVLASVAMSISRVETEQIDTAYGSLTVLEALDKIKPENIYIMLGSNGAAYMTVADMYQSYQAFLNKVRIACPDAKLYIISAPPVTEGKENSNESPIKNSVLDELNSKLLEYADNNGVYYLDMNSALKNELGYLPADYAENDGMHLKYSTYTEFIDYILTHVAK